MCISDPGLIWRTPVCLPSYAHAHLLPHITRPPLPRTTIQPWRVDAWVMLHPLHQAWLYRTQPPGKPVYMLTLPPSPTPHVVENEWDVAIKTSHLPIGQIKCWWAGLVISCPGSGGDPCLAHVAATVSCIWQEPFCPLPSGFAVRKCFPVC